VRSKTWRSFWKAFDALPADVQAMARTKFKLWNVRPEHPSLHFKELQKGVWSVRITEKYRALGLRERDLIVWYWIGTHDEYDKLV